MPVESNGSLLIPNFWQDFHLDRPDVHPNFWRYVLHTTESFIKYEQPWEINLKKKNGKEQKQDGATQPKQQGNPDNQSQPKQNCEQGDRKQNETDQGKDTNGSNSNSKISHEEQALLEFLQNERKLRSLMQKDDGKGFSPLQDETLPEQIDEADQFTRDSWIPRNDKLIRLTGKHPLHAEADLRTLFEAGLITPSPIHYVRNHGAVPHLLWENHTLEVTASEKLTFMMDDLKEEFESINIPIFIACDGSRRKELNMIKKTRGFNFTAAAAGCSYWRGVLLRDVLTKAGATEMLTSNPDKNFWVNYHGADELGQGKYEMSIPLEYAMDATNDVILAYEMNDHPIHPDHGYPLRLIVPGWVGARSVKWLSKIWISEDENDSYYHIYDNRQLPSFVTDTASDLAQIMFRHPSTICNEQMLNSVVVRPEQGERVDLVDVKLGKKYRIQGYAYNGSGNEIDKVEISLDDGDSWLYCVRKVSWNL
jgi:nitrate reductase (NAD(P)H)